MFSRVPLVGRTRLSTFTKSLWARSEKLCAVPQTGRSLTADRLPLGRELIQPAGTPRHVTETRPLGQGPAQLALQHQHLWSLELERNRAREPQSPRDPKTLCVFFVRQDEEEKGGNLWCYSSRQVASEIEIETDRL